MNFHGVFWSSVYFLPLTSLHGYFYSPFPLLKRHWATPTYCTSGESILSFLYLAYLPVSVLASHSSFFIALSTFLEYTALS